MLSFPALLGSHGLTVLTAVVSCLGVQTVDPLAPEIQRAGEVIAPVAGFEVDCPEASLRSATTEGHFGRATPAPGVLREMSRVVDLLRAPPCDTDVTLLDQAMNDGVSVFQVIVGFCWTMRQYLFAQAADGSLRTLDPESPDFRHDFRELFWDPGCQSEECLQEYASFLVKVLHVNSWTAFIPSKEVAAFVLSQPARRFESRPVDALMQLRWPYPSISVRGAVTNADTYLWHRVTGEVTRFSVTIESDGSVRWSEGVIGRQKYE